MTLELSATSQLGCTLLYANRNKLAGLSEEYYNYIVVLQQLSSTVRSNLIHDEIYNNGVLSIAA